MEPHGRNARKDANRDSYCRRLAFKIMAAFISDGGDSSAAGALYSWNQTLTGGSYIDHHGTAANLIRHFYADGWTLAQIEAAALEDLAVLVCGDDQAASVTATANAIIQRNSKLADLKTFLADLSSKPKSVEYAKIANKFNRQHPPRPPAVKITREQVRAAVRQLGAKKHWG
jgi:hypothetical protein